MCKDAVKTLGTIASAIEPTIIQLLTLLKVTPEVETEVTNAWNAVVTASNGWTSGTTIQNAEGAITAFNTVFDALPVPANLQELSTLISAGVDALLGVLQANEAPEPTVQAAAQIAHAVTTKIKTKVPEVQKIDLHHPEKAVEQYNSLWATKLAKVQPTDTTGSNNTGNSKPALQK